MDENMAKSGITTKERVYQTYHQYTKVVLYATKFGRKLAESSSDGASLLFKTQNITQHSKDVAQLHISLSQSPNDPLTPNIWCGFYAQCSQSHLAFLSGNK